ncbi:uncharacterized protein [Rutidosis leptorrhynchoides]|uniref:uncharacterized protein n=1 Tax=Rutidosis leptorrhynchoides TaxID=125765 RepID=UPI003A997385
MGNCQASEGATVMIVHPDNKIEWIYWTVTARDVMNSNNGYYVAQVLKSETSSANGLPVKQLKLLRPDDTLLMGQVYRLISYQDVVKEFAAKKCMKLGKLLMERGVIELRKGNDTSSVVAPVPAVPNSGSVKRLLWLDAGWGHMHDLGFMTFLRISLRQSRRLNGGRQQHQSQGGGQWKPALKSISEIGN